MTSRPPRLVAVVGTGTDVGKTWVSARLLTTLREAGVTVAARKPAQSFSADEDPARHDSAILGAATGEPSETVCLPHRWYPVAMAPPMAADVLGRDRMTTADFMQELTWPATGVSVGLVETAGGVRSPQTHDGDARALLDALIPDVILLVADAGLGTINAVRLTADTLAGKDVVVVLNRFDRDDDLHQRNRDWLHLRDEMTVIALPGEERQLASIVRGTSAAP